MKNFILFAFLFFQNSAFVYAQDLGLCSLYVGCNNYSHITCGLSNISAALSACEISGCPGYPCIQDISSMSGLKFVYSGAANACYKEWIVCEDNINDPEPDTDGDGIPDTQDPCPNNPSPTCAPQPPEPPKIPEKLQIGDCEIDISGLNDWILGNNSFPFNIIYRVYSIISVFFNADPIAPAWTLEMPLDPNSKYSWIPDSHPININLSMFDSIASMLRTLETVLVAWGFALYGKRRLLSFSGVQGD